MRNIPADKREVMISLRNQKLMTNQQEVIVLSVGTVNREDGTTCEQGKTCIALGVGAMCPNAIMGGLATLHCFEGNREKMLSRVQELCKLRK